jgi:hypothetical protein
MGNVQSLGPDLSGVRAMKPPRLSPLGWLVVAILGSVIGLASAALAIWTMR